MQIVSYFHSRKGCHAVDKMLHNLYKPILWKALSVRMQLFKTPIFYYFILV